MVKCICGRNPSVIIDDYSPKKYWIACSLFDCWRGPKCDTEEEAIEKWNDLMRNFQPRFGE